MRMLLLLVLLPASLAASDHIEIAVQCYQDVPIVLAVRMRQADTVQVSVLAMMRYCEHE